MAETKQRDEGAEREREKLSRKEDLGGVGSGGIHSQLCVHLGPSSWSLISCAVWTWYLVCLAPTFIRLGSLFILMDPFAFFSDMTMLRTVWFIHMKV